MATHEFLSPGWIEAAREIRAEEADRGEPPALSVRMNLVIESVPFEESTLYAHLDTSQGSFDLDIGHLDSYDVKVSLDYATAKAILVDGDAQAAMQGFMGGRIRVEGDLTKLLTFQATPPSSRQQAIGERMRAITA
jgi:hypothetical protein